MQIGTLSQVTITSSLLEAYIEGDLNKTTFLLEANPATTPIEVDKLINWVDRNLNVKPRIWMTKQLTRLNTLMQMIKVREETQPENRSLWSKIKSKLADLIMKVTHAIQTFVTDRKDSKEAILSDGSKHEFKYARMQTDSQTNKTIEHINKILDKLSDPNDKKMMHNFLVNANYLHNKINSRFPDPTDSKEYHKIDKDLGTMFPNGKNKEAVLQARRFLRDKMRRLA